MTTKKYEQINTAGVKVGDYLRVKPATTYTGDWSDPDRQQVPDPGYVESARPGFEKGEPAKVLAITKVDGSKALDLELYATGEKVSTHPRAGTAFWYRNTLTSAGQPHPEEKYPVCPTCKADEDNPACTTKTGGWSSPHKAREKLMQAAAQVKAAGNTVRVVRKYPDGKVGVVEALRLKTSDLNVGDLVQAFRTEDPASGGYAFLHQGHVESAESLRVQSARRSGLVGWLLVFRTEDGQDVEGALGVCVDGSEWTVLERNHNGQRAASRSDALADGPKPEQLTAEQERARDAEPVEYDESDPVGKGEERCPTCKSFGLVRGVGPDAGKHYKTINGALQAEAKGNAKPCPDCEHGAEVAA